MASEALADRLRARAVVLRDWLDRVEARAGGGLITSEWRADAELHEDVATEISRLTRELEEARRERSAARAEAMTAQASLRRAKRELEAARERVLGVRSAVIRATAALVRLDLRWDPREEAEWVRRRPVVAIATRLKDDVLALSIPQEASGAD